MYHKYRSCYSLEHFIIAKKNVLQPELFLFRSGSRSGSSVRISAPEDGVDGNGSDEEYNGNFLVFECDELLLRITILPPSFEVLKARYKNNGLAKDKNISLANYENMYWV